MSDLEKINQFLAEVDLQRYRDKYSRIKLVELDLDRNIQCIYHLYQEYWENRSDFPSFDEFYDLYLNDLRTEIENFRKDKMFSNETFYRGLPARIYRTWASLLTQIQGGYAAEEIYGCGCVKMNAALDYAGIDMEITDKKSVINIQIKKETVSREVRTPWQDIKKNKKIVMVTYEVPGCDPLTKKGTLRVPFERWQEKWDGKLRRLDNGFIIFTPQMFARDYIKTP
ncbi:MAG: TaqI family restriction endonuclease [Gammaproteobacteria bacterium WSBS_2016_MAG_OTU1]